MTFHTKCQPVLSADDITSHIKTHFEDLLNKEGKNQPSQGSGWTLSRVRRLVMNFSQYHPLKGSSFVELPKWVKDKKACINVQNTDNFCFIYCVLCALNDPQIHPERTYHYGNRINDDIFQGFTYPLSLSDIVKFEKRSQKGYANYPSMAINVYEIGKKMTSTNTERSLNGKTTEKDDIRPVLISTFHNSAEKEIDLLYITDDNS
ncbi:unnamed protein product, partial [Nesidiocoris tenuis]